jgi:hypothetical protein
VAEHEFAGVRCSEVADLAPAFVLGGLEAAEMDRVRRHLASCPEAHPEFAELGGVAPVLFETVEIVPPPPDLKARILAAAAAERPSAVEAPAVPPVTREARDIRQLPGAGEPAPDRRGGLADLFRRPVWAAVAMAAALAVVALGAWNLQLRDQLADLTAYRSGVAEILDQAAKPGSRLAVLTAAGGVGPSGLAAVSSTGQVGVVMRDLAPTTGTEVYETWLIGADGQPIPIGGFTVDASGTASFVATPGPLAGDVTVALTREPGPGATTPTEPIIAAGAAEPRAQSS